MDTLRRWFVEQLQQLVRRRRTVATEAPMLYTLLADVTVLIHLSFVGFVAVGGFLAWRWPMILTAHLPAAGWALGIVAIGWPCPLTELEKRLRLWAGTGGYSGAFMDRYVTGVLYPEQHARAAQALVAAVVLSSYAGWGGRQYWRSGDPGGRVDIGPPTSISTRRPR